AQPARNRSAARAITERIIVCSFPLGDQRRVRLQMLWLFSRITQVFYHLTFFGGIPMMIFLDTGSTKEIREAASWGVLDGVTTNPSLVAKEGRSFKDLLLESCTIVDGPISAEVVSLEADAMIKEGKDLAKIHKNIVVKVPLTPEGLKACKALTTEGIRVNVTLCFSPNQALLAAKAGAWCVSPFIGRLDDISEHGMGLIQDIVTIYRNYHFKTKVLVASVRHPRHVVEAAKIGGDICTISYAVFCLKKKKKKNNAERKQPKTTATTHKTSTNDRTISKATWIDYAHPTSCHVRE